MNGKLAIAAVSLSIISFMAFSMAHAQTATDLQCAQCVGTSDIASGAVATGKLKNGSIATSKLRNGAVATNKLKDGAVSRGKIKDDAVNPDKLSPDVRALLDTIGQLQGDVVQLQSELDSLNLGSLGALADVVVVDGDTVRFEGVNVQIVNGLGQTDSIDGTGNLIVGYDEDVGVNGFGSRQICSDGDFDSQAECLANGGTFGSAQKTGSHNLVVGMGHSYTQFGGTVLASRNAINQEHANVTGGESNVASGPAASVSGGSTNVASGETAAISGGASNEATDEDASVSGGSGNLASGRSSSVSGGLDNIASGNQTSISGGFDNTANAQVSSVSGGLLNSASGNFSSVTGGNGNTASGSSSVVSGGLDRTANGLHDWRAGSLFESD